MKPVRANPAPVDSAAVAVVAIASAEAAVTAAVVADVPAAVAVVAGGRPGANLAGKGFDQSSGIFIHNGE